MKTSRNTTLTLAVLSLLLTTAVFTGCSKLSNEVGTNENPPNNQETEIIQGEPNFGEEAETYHNTNLNFSLQYPKSAEFDKYEYDFTTMHEDGNYSMGVTIQFKDPRDLFVELTVHRSEFLFQNGTEVSDIKGVEINSLDTYVKNICIEQSHVQNVQLDDLNGFKVECIYTQYSNSANVNKYPPQYFFEKNGWVYKFNAIIGTLDFTDQDQVFFTEVLKGFSIQ